MNSRVKIVFIKELINLEKTIVTWIKNLFNDVLYLM
jgi:hypothetical protein